MREIDFLYNVNLYEFYKKYVNKNENYIKLIDNYVDIKPNFNIYITREIISFDVFYNYYFILKIEDFIMSQTYRVIDKELINKINETEIIIDLINDFLKDVDKKYLSYNLNKKLKQKELNKGVMKI